MTSSVVFGIDPALRTPGVAVTVDRVVVVAAALHMPSAVNDLEIAERIDVVAQHCVEWFLARAWASGGFDLGSQMFNAWPVTTIYEKPQVYGGPRAEDPNDVMHIGMVAASVWTLMRARGSTRVLSPTPRQWTGGLEKTKTKVGYWKSPRGQHLARRLSPAERELIGDSHDAADAVSLCLFACGRWAARRVNARPRAAPQP